MIKEIKGDDNFCNLYMFYQLFQKNLMTEKLQKNLKFHQR